MSAPPFRAQPDASRRLQLTRQGLRRALPPELLRLDDLRLESDGTLQITGEVRDVASKKKALRIAAILSDAPGLVDRLHVHAPAQMSDAQILSRLLDLFRLDPRLTGIEVCEGTPDRGLGVSVADGIVTLDGAVPSLVRKRLAGVIAWRIAGVRDVVNGLGVEPPEQDGPDELEEAVRAALDGNPLFDDAQVKVGVLGDVVRLTGLVHSRDAKAAAEEEAWRVLGVDDVVNEIELR